MDKLYLIRHGKGGNAEFGCTGCAYRVRTKDFDRRNGNVRTQAAAAMTAHQAVEHKRSFLNWASQSAGKERVWTR